jgi:pimeloyl-ACP methyl ester carboxylesterase
MRLAALLWPFPFGVRLGWATTRVPNPEIRQARARAYLLRGQAIVFSRGFGAMCDRLRREGVWAEDLRGVGDCWVRRHLIADREAGRLVGPVILVGHSCGARYSLYTAHELARHGIEVELIVCVDVAIPFEVAANVRHAANLYRSRCRIYPARPLVGAAGSAARIANVDLDAEDSPIAPTGLHHLNMTASQAVQDWIVARVLEAVETAEAEGRGR